MAYVLHHLLTESAERRPDAEAVRLLDQALTYGELEKLSNPLAHALIEIGVLSGDRIGIYLHKSPAAIASIFGILKTGACYVPVDPNAPGLRLAEIARQCSFRALITRRRPGAFGSTGTDRKSTRLNSSHITISYAVFCLK